MNSDRRLESNTPRALRSQPCVARISINSCPPIERWSQILRILIFHLACSNHGQSGERTLCLPPGRRSAGEASVEETRAFPCPKLVRVHVDQRGGKEW